MGVERLPAIVEALRAGGRAADTPVAVIQAGTCLEQRTVVSTLAEVVQDVEVAALRPPAVTIVGDVVKLRERLRWFDTRPLFGRRVLVTRTREQASTLVEQLRGAGARAVELPTIAIRPPASYAELDAALLALAARSRPAAGYQRSQPACEVLTQPDHPGEAVPSLDPTSRGADWVIFTSTNGVEAVAGRLAVLGLDARAFGGAQLGAIGPATAQALQRLGLRPDYAPSEALTSRILADFAANTGSLRGARVLLPRADIAPPDLANGLRELGAEVESVVAYCTSPQEDLGQAARRILGAGDVDTACFTSSSTVRNLVQALDFDLTLLAPVTIACIGPVTAGTARDLGLHVDVVAREHTVPGLVAALIEHATLQPTGP
jgi:uroporphyrinogen III methyltransferase/synthase